LLFQAHTFLDDADLRDLVCLSFSRFCSALVNGISKSTLALRVLDGALTAGFFGEGFFGEERLFFVVERLFFAAATFAFGGLFAGIFTGLLAERFPLLSSLAGCFGPVYMTMMPLLSFFFDSKDRRLLRGSGIAL
jgi:hypothetical protein